ILAALLMVAPVADWAQEAPAKPLPPKVLDVIVMKNGDRLSGEIKRIEHGLLYFETSYVSGEVVAVDWLQVEKIESARAYRIELENGDRLIGQVALVPVPGTGQPGVAIHGEQRDTQVAREDVIGLYWQKRNFFRQMKGNIDFGYSYTSGDDQVQGD